MAVDRPLESVSDADLFRAATQPAAEGQAPEATPPRPPPEEPPVPEKPPAPEPTPSPAASPSTPEGVPSWRLREEAEARRVAEDRARLLESRLAEVAAHMQQQEGRKPDFFDDPTKATEALLVRYLQPYAEETRKERMYNNKLLAGALHGNEKVEEAENAFLEARANETLDPVDYESVIQSPNRYDAVVKWHKKRSTLAAVGDDPVAWFNKQLDNNLADPKFQAKLLERIQGSAAARPSETRLPPTLSRSTSVAASNGAGRSPGDGSDSSLWSFATSSGPARGGR
jgi:hypothetical protein